MGKKSFFFQLLLLSSFAAIGLFFAHRLPILKPYSWFSWSTMLAFIALCVLMYFVGYRAALSKNKNDFTNAFLIFLMAKLFLCAGLAIGYLKIYEPESKLFVLPFFALYLVYTIFEVYFLSKLGRMKPA